MVASLKRNDVYVLAKEELFINSFVKWLAKKTKVIPVKRGKQDVALLKNSVKILKENHIILLFPEGTRNRNRKKGKTSKWSSTYEFNVRRADSSNWYSSNQEI